VPKSGAVAKLLRPILRARYVPTESQPECKSLCSNCLGAAHSTVGVPAVIPTLCIYDFEEATIRVVQSKTTAGLRTLPMSQTVRSALLEWQSTTNGISEYVFFNPQCPNEHLRSVKKAWHHALKMAGLSGFPIYQCRHTHATRLAAAGVSDTIIDQLLGHSRRDVLPFYTARVLENLRDAISLLDRLRCTKSEPSSGSPAEFVEHRIKKIPFLLN